MVHNEIPAEKSVANALKRLLAKGEVDDAIQFFKNWLKSHSSPDLLRAHLNKKIIDALESATTPFRQATGRAELFMEAGFAGEAERCLREEAQARPSAYVISEYASVLARIGQGQQSLDAYNRAIAMSPEAGNLHFEHGRLLQSLARHSEAREALQRACSIEPTNADYCLELGNTLKTMQDLTGAEEFYSRAISARPDYAEAYNNRGTVRRHMRQFKNAYADFSAAITKNPVHLYAYLNRGGLLTEEGHHDQARKDFEYALAIAPDNPDAYHGLAEVLHQLGRQSDAIAHIDAAILFGARGSRYHFSRGNYLRSAGRSEEAAAAYRNSTESDDRFLEGYINWSVALQDLGCHQEAIQVLDRAITVRPDYNEAFYNKANSMLCLGLSEDAWRSYERRHQLSSEQQLPSFGRPLLGEQSPEGKSLLLQWDQRTGDVIQVLRYIPLIEAAASKCYWQVVPEIRSLVSASYPELKIIGRPECPDEVEFRLPITSLPLAMKTFERSAIPRKVPYLTPSRAAVDKWKHHISDARPRVGIAWRGRPVPVGRSIPLVELEDLFHNSNVTFFSLQVAPTAEERALMTRHGIIDLSADIDTYDDTAAIMSMLDLVITIDTSVAHLSGALGLKTWVMLKFGGDWRWHLNGSESDWYPTARIYRQAQFADWTGVVRRLDDDLKIEIDGLLDKRAVAAD